MLRIWPWKVANCFGGKRVAKISNRIAGLRHGMDSCSPQAAQTTVANAKLEAMCGSCGYYRQPGAGVFFCPCIWQKKPRRAPKLNCKKMGQ